MCWLSSCRLAAIRWRWRGLAPASVKAIPRAAKAMMVSLWCILPATRSQIRLPSIWMCRPTATSGFCSRCWRACSRGAQRDASHGCWPYSGWRLKLWARGLWPYCCAVGISIRGMHWYTGCGRALCWPCASICRSRWPMGWWRRLCWRLMMSGMFWPRCY